MSKIGAELTMKAPERRKLTSFGVFIVNFEQFSGIVLIFLLLTM